MKQSFFSFSRLWTMSLLFVSSFIFSMPSCDAEIQKEHFLSDLPSQILKDRISIHDKRYASFFHVLELLEQQKPYILIETGTARGGNQNFVGDGGSTILFGEWAWHHDAEFYSVDIDSQAIHRARDAVASFGDNIHFVTADSIQFLKEFSDPIDFLYLDSFDFDSYNPGPSQNHHLYEIQTAYSKLHDKSIVMIDDCDLPYGGKGKLAIEFLLERGWKIIHKGYQVILMQETAE